MRTTICDTCPVCGASTDFTEWKSCANCGCEAGIFQAPDDGALSFWGGEFIHGYIGAPINKVSLGFSDRVNEPYKPIERETDNPIKEWKYRRHPALWKNFERELKCRAYKEMKSIPTIQSIEIEIKIRLNQIQYLGGCLQNKLCKDYENQLHCEIASLRCVLGGLTNEK